MSDDCYCQTTGESVQKVKRENAMLRDKGFQNLGETHVFKKKVQFRLRFLNHQRFLFHWQAQ
jgi:hypothetical protein